MALPDPPAFFNQKWKDWAAAVNNAVSGSGGTSTTASANNPVATLTRSITTVMEPTGNFADNFGPRIRPVEQRRLLRIINTGVNPIRIGYSSQLTNASFSATAYQYQLNAGQELVDTSGDPSAIYLSDVGHQLALSALVITETLS